MSDALRFRRCGRAWHACVDHGGDLEGVLDLDEALWVVTSAPVETFRADPALLAALDADGDGRIRVDDVCASIRWLLASLRDPSDISPGHDQLRLSALRDGCDALRASGALVLRRSGAAADGAVTLAAVRALRVQCGDGVPSATAAPAMRALCASVADRVDHYFNLCDTIRLDPRVVAGADATHVDVADPASVAAFLVGAPVAPPREDGLLHLEEGVNPSHAPALRRLAREVVGPLSGGRSATLDRAGWRAIQGRLATVAAPADAGPDADAIAGLADLERLLLLQAWMLPFVNGFVTGRDIYRAGVQPLFNWGTLVVDGRRFTLAIRVLDSASHEAFTRDGALCVLYVQVGDREGAWDYEVAVPFTSGRLGRLVEGMWGIFVEPDGRERHAQVRRLVLNPISLQDALVSPFRRLSDALERALDGGDGAPTAPALSRLLPVVKPPPAAPTASPAAAKGMPSTTALTMVAGAGLALAAVTSAVTYVGDRFVAATSAIGAWLTDLPLVGVLPPRVAAGVAWGAYPFAVLVVIVSVAAGLALLYVIPVSISAWLKLRRRDFGVLLMGSGWAVNTRMSVTAAVARDYTRTPPIARQRRDGGLPVPLR